MEQVRAAEAELMARLPEGALMQRAAAGLAYAVIDLLGSAYGRRVLLLVGSGDNGGDALYAGALLARRGVQVEAWLLSDRAHEGGIAADHQRCHQAASRMEKNLRRAGYTSALLRITTGMKRSSLIAAKALIKVVAEP